MTRAEARRGGFASPHDVLAYLLLGPEELESFTAGSPINTDDNARIEFAAPRDLLGYAKFDPYLAKVYGPLWPYGRLTELVHGYDVADRDRAAPVPPPGAQPARATARRARRSCGPGAAEAAGAGRPRRSTRGCCCDLVVDPPRSRSRRSRSRPATSWQPAGRAGQAGRRAPGLRRAW